jgi:hypothetical protein
MTSTRAWTDGVVVAAESGSKRRVEGRGALSIHGSFCLFENIFILTATQLELSIAIFGHVTLQGKVLLH